MEGLRERREHARRLRRGRQRRRVGGIAALALLIAVLVVVLTSGGGAARRESPALAATYPLASPRPALALTTAQRPQHGAHREPADRQRRRELAAIRRAGKHHNYVVSGRPRHRVIALTFDDGPGPLTPALLTFLEAHDVPATFFVIGAAANDHPETVRAESRAGFAIGDHTELHKRLEGASVALQKQQINDGATSIHAIIGKRLRLFRPPEGLFDTTTQKLVEQAGMLMVLWSVDTSDYTKPGAAVIARRALAGARPGGIILMHDGGGDRSQTLAAVPVIVHGLRSRGFKLVTVPQLLVYDPVPADQPPPHSIGEPR